MTLTKRISGMTLLLLSMLGFMAGCVLETSSEPSRQPSRQTEAPKLKKLDPAQEARLQSIMIPLLRAGDKTRSLKDPRVAVIDDPSINAANGGGGEFYVTTGLLQKANDEHLRGVLAHEIAHDDLGHVARAQVLGVGLNLAVILLEQIFPGSSAINAYSRDTSRAGLQPTRRA